MDSFSVSGSVSRGTGTYWGTSSAAMFMRMTALGFLRGAFLPLPYPGSQVRASAMSPSW